MQVEENWIATIQGKNLNEFVVDIFTTNILNNDQSNGN